MFSALSVQKSILFAPLVSTVSVRSFPRVGHGVGQPFWAVHCVKTPPRRGAKAYTTRKNCAAVNKDYADVIPNPDKPALPPRALAWDSKTTSPGHAYQKIFNRRLRRGQSYATLALGWSEFTPSYFGPFQEETRVFEALPDIQIPSMLRGVFQTGYRAPFRAVFDTDLCIHHGVLIYPERGDCL